MARLIQAAGPPAAHTRRRQAALLALEVVAVGCGVDPSSFRRASRADVKRLQTNSAEAVYFAGMSLAGLPVTDAVGQGRGRQIVEIYARSPAEDRRVAEPLRRVDGKPTARRLPEPPENVRAVIERACPSR